MSQAFSISVVLLVTGILACASAHAHQQLSYCPNTKTDSDGDGWGWENGQSCIVLKAKPNTPICENALLDTDGDGWSWEKDQSCLIDNSEERLVSTTGNSPLTSSFSQSFVPPNNYVISSNGTIYIQNYETNQLTATNSDGSTKWKADISFDFVGQKIEVNESRQIVVAVSRDSTMIAFDTRDGAQLWVIRPFERLFGIDLATDAIIISGDTQPDSQVLQTRAAFSLNYDATLRWEYHTERPVSDVVVGRNGKVYLIVLTPDFESVTTYVLQQ